MFVLFPVQHKKVIIISINYQVDKPNILTLNEYTIQQNHESSHKKIRYKPKTKNTTIILQP